MTIPAFPALDQFLSELSVEEQAAISLLDQERLTVERDRASAQTARQMTEPAYGVVRCLRLWSGTVHCLEHHWFGGRYMVYEYLNDLTVRDGLAEYLLVMPPGLTAKVQALVDVLDARYRAATTDDRGVELAKYWKPPADGRENRWWWTRKPLVLPTGW